MLHKKRSHRNEKPGHHNQGVAPAHQNWRKPKRSTEDPAQPKINKLKKIFFKNMYMERVTLLYTKN